MTTDPGDLMLDPTCGSGTTAYVAEHWGRRWITIGTSRVSIALARTRLMAARYPYYLLADTPEGRKKEAEISGQFSVISDLPESSSEPDIKRGFVYERVPHVTLKSIANNEEIDEIHARYQPGLDALRAEINKLAKKKWEEWEIPKTVDGGQLAVLGEPLETHARLDQPLAERLLRRHQADRTGNMASGIGSILGDNVIGGDRKRSPSPTGTLETLSGKVK